MMSHSEDKPYLSNQYEKTFYHKIHIKNTLGHSHTCYMQVISVTEDEDFEEMQDQMESEKIMDFLV